MHRKQTEGFLLVMAASALYGLSPLFITSLSENGAHFSNVMFFKGGISALELALLSGLSRQRMRLTRKENRDAMLLGALRGLTCFFLFGSYEWITTGLATSIHFTFPLFVMLLGLLLFHGKPQAGGLLSLIMTLTGIALFVWNASGSSASGLGIVFAIVSAVMYAAYLVALDKCEIERIPPMVYAMYEMAYSAVFALISSTMIGKMRFTLTPTGWLVAWLGATLTAACVIMMKIGVKRIDAQQASILCVLEPIVSVIAGALVMHEIITLKLAVGIVLIIGASIVTVTTAGKRNAGTDAAALRDLPECRSK